MIQWWSFGPSGKNQWSISGFYLIEISGIMFFSMMINDELVDLLVRNWPDDSDDH
jgi:hypothetical protein